MGEKWKRLNGSEMEQSRARGGEGKIKARGPGQTAVKKGEKKGEDQSESEG